MQSHQKILNGVEIPVAKTKWSKMCCFFHWFLWYFYLYLTDLYLRWIWNPTSWVNLEQTGICWVNTFTAKSTDVLSWWINYRNLYHYTSVHLHATPTTLVIHLFHTQWRYQVIALGFLSHCDETSDVSSVSACAVHWELVLDSQPVHWLWYLNAVVSSAIYQCVMTISGCEGHTWNRYCEKGILWKQLLVTIL